MAKADSPTKKCGEDGCVRPLRARGLCNSHYNASRYTSEQRRKKHPVPCAWCGAKCMKDARRSTANRYCSDECKGFMYSYEARGPISMAVTKWHRAHPDYRPPLPVLYVPPAPKPEPARRWVAGYCGNCGSPFITLDYTGTARWCSKRCIKRVTKDRYRARRRGAFVGEVWRQRIFERDRWICQLCRKRVARTKVVPHPKAPVLDHVVPLAEGGTHEPANVQCAHFMCNSIKSDKGGSQQLALIG